jgi:hypothetical protein
MAQESRQLKLYNIKIFTKINKFLNFKIEEHADKFGFASDTMNLEWQD